ncbi:aldehyde dehydrogenase family protein [Streptomyces albus]|nr:aldehyde dehydrogenase family protein [Streptomyces albus]
MATGPGPGHREHRGPQALAETTPDTALLLGEDAAGLLGDDVVCVLPGDRETGALLVDSRVDAVAFTGSTVGGLDVAYRAGLRPVSLELGGNCAALVLPDAPAYTCASLAAASVFNAGQSCAAPARVITLPENHDAVVEGLAREMGRKVAGVDFGPLNNADQAARYDHILSASRAGVRHNGRIEPGPECEGATGGRPWSSPTWPTTTRRCWRRSSDRC